MSEFNSIEINGYNSEGKKERRKLIGFTDNSSGNKNPESLIVTAKALESIKGGGSFTIKIEQDHDFKAGNWLYHNGEKFLKADCSDGKTSGVSGIVSKTENTSSFELSVGGIIDIAGLTPGHDYYLYKDGDMTDDPDLLEKTDYKVFLGTAISDSKLFINWDIGYSMDVSGKTEHFNDYLKGYIKGGTLQQITTKEELDSAILNGKYWVMKELVPANSIAIVKVERLYTTFTLQTLIAITGYEYPQYSRYSTDEGETWSDWKRGSYTATEMDANWKVKTLKGTGAAKVTNDGKGNYTVGAAGYDVKVTDDKKGNYNIDMQHQGNDHNCTFLTHMGKTKKWNDVSLGGAYHGKGTATGSPTISSDTPFKNGSPEGSTRFSEKVQHIKYTKHTDFYLNTANCTLDFWVKILKRPNTSAGGDIMGLCHSIADQQGWGVHYIYHPEESYNAIELAPAGVYKNWKIWNNPTLNKWTHIAICANSALPSNYKYCTYVDGKLSHHSATSWLKSTKFDKITEFNLGSCKRVVYIQALNGMVTEVRFSNIARYTNHGFAVPDEPYGPDARILFAKRSGECYKLPIEESWDKEEYTETVPPKYVEFFKYDDDKLWIPDEDTKDMLIEYLTSEIITQTDSRINEEAWEDDIPQGKLGFDTRDEAKAMIKSLPDKTMEELIKLIGDNDE